MSSPCDNGINRKIPKGSLRFFVPFLVLLMVALSNCKDMNYTEEDTYRSEEVFIDFDRTGSMINDIYAYLPDYLLPIGGSMRACASDEAEQVLSTSAIQKFNDGSWSKTNTVDDVWENMYKGIRQANYLLKHMEEVDFSSYKYHSAYAGILQVSSYWTSEARFLRAFFYFELIKRYHNVPLVTTVLTPEEANIVENDSFEDIVNFIVSECDAVIPILPVTHQPVLIAMTGRATLGAAQALKARTLLYAASPLFNPTGNLQKWTDAAKAAKIIIDGNRYSLLPSYATILNNITSKELIFDRRYADANSFERANFPIGYEGGNTGTCPTQNLVDAYEMKTTGLAISNPGSGYDPANPYTNRDPRLAATVIYNGSTWKSSPVEIWKGGKNAPPKVNATKTGYYLKRYVVEAVNLAEGKPITTARHNASIFRYGEVLLNYAEAMNEAYGPEVTGPAPLNMTARAAVNLIRTRAQMPVFPAGMSQSDFRTKLRNERRVELAFEDHRFWDIRRWKIGNTNTAIYGVDLVKDATNKIIYTNKLIEQRVWDDRMYFYPIPQTEVFINPKLGQNAGW
jgi:hypothetical protein